jgi:hypothetical protein
MLDPLDPLTYELCFPGSLTGETEIECPHCNTLLTVPVNDPYGEESYQCCECNGHFVANWADKTVTPTVSLSLNINIAYEDPEEGKMSSN